MIETLFGSFLRFARDWDGFLREELRRPLELPVIVSLPDEGSRMECWGWTLFLTCPE